MNWSGPQELKAQLLCAWERGELLREAVTGPSLFPWRLALKAPASADITDHFDAVRSWASALSAVPWLRLEWRALRHRVQGSQRLPESAWVDTLDAALDGLGKRRDWARFTALLPWLAQRPLQALALAEAWPRLLAVVAWVRDHPHPGIYLRQWTCRACTPNLSNRTVAPWPNCWT